MILDRFGQLLQRSNDSFNSLVDTALDFHRVVTGGHQLDAFTVDGLSQYRSGGGAVTGNIGSLGSNFLDHLCTHILELVFQFDLLGDGNAVLGDQWERRSSCR